MSHRAEPEARGSIGAIGGRRTALGLTRNQAFPRAVE